MQRKMTSPLKKWRSAHSLLACIAACLFTGIAQAAPAGVVTHLSGTLSVKRADGSSKLLSIKSEVLEGDTLSTAPETYARVKFNDGGEVVLRPGTDLKVESYAFNQAQPASDNVVLSMFKGGLRAVTGLVGRRNKEKVSFNTETATIGIRGTHFGALLCRSDCGGVPTVTGKPPADGLHVDVAVGAVVVSNPAGQQQINAGQFGYVSSPTVPPQIVPPQQGIQVTMPQSIAENKGSGKSVGKGDATECKM